MASNKDRAIAAVEDASVFYQRFETIFEENIAVYKHRDNSFGIFGYCGIEKCIPINQTSDLFNFFPSGLLEDDKEYNALFGKLTFSAYLKPALPFPLSLLSSAKTLPALFGSYCRVNLSQLGVIDYNTTVADIKQCRRVSIKNSAEIRTAIQDMFVILKRSAEELKKAEKAFFFPYKDHDLWIKLIVIEYRCKSAIAWLDYLK